MTKPGDETSRRWLEPVLTSPEIRRDAVRVLCGISCDRNLLDRAAASLANFESPGIGGVGGRGQGDAA